MVAARQPLKVFLKSIRINNWTKNALIFLPLLAAHCLEVPAWTQALLAFLAFGLCASGTYLINDLLDIPNDRSHPIKSKRPRLLAACLFCRAAHCPLSCWQQRP